MNREELTKSKDINDDIQMKKPFSLHGFNKKNSALLINIPHYHDDHIIRFLILFLFSLYFVVQKCWSILLELTMLEFCNHVLSPILNDSQLWLSNVFHSWIWFQILTY